MPLYDHGAMTSPARRHSLQTIADLAQVHVSTVSRALDPERSQLVGADTVARIRQIADELGFEPNPWARSLRTNRTRTLGLVIPRLVDSVLANIFEAAEAAAAAAHHQAITVSTGDDPEHERDVVRSLLDRRVDGLILATARLQDATVDDLAEAGIPFVLINRTNADHLCVRGHDEEGAYRATQHLLERGHRRIALAIGRLDTSTSAWRRDGYARALREAGRAVDDELVIESGLDIDSGYEVGTGLLSRPDRPSAVLAVNDYVAIGVMSAARDLGVAVPDDLAVVGFNDARLARALLVPLSSVALPLATMGRLAVEMLLDRIAGKRVESVILTPELVVRASSERRVGPPVAG